MFKKQKINGSEIIKFGFLGGIAETTYIFLVVLTMNSLGKIMPQQPDILAGMMMLLLFVFSAGVSGVLVFGYPAYLAFQKRFNEALMTAVLTLATMVIAGILVFILASII